MTTRAVGAGASIEWLKRALDLGRNNPRAIFGGASLLLAAMLVLAFGLSLVVGLLAAMAKPDGLLAGALSLSLGAALMALMAALMVGYLRLLDAVENGRPARATDVFAGVSDKAATLRAIGFLLVLMLAQNGLMFTLVGLLAPEFGSWYLQNLQVSMSGENAPPPTALPPGFGAAVAVIWVLAMLSYAVQAIGLGQIALRGRGIGGALSDGLSGALKNLFPLLVLFLLVVLAAIVLALVLVLLALLVGVAAKLAGGWLLALVGIPAYFACVVAMMEVMFGVMYFLRRDVCEGGMPPPAPAAGDAFEA